MVGGLLRDKTRVPPGAGKACQPENASLAYLWGSEHQCGLHFHPHVGSVLHKRRGLERKDAERADGEMLGYRNSAGEV